MTVETQTSQGIRVSVTRQNAESGQVSLLSPATASAMITGSTIVTIGCKPIATVKTCLETQPTVNVGMVYTTTVTDDLEMWWCDSWRVLWNKNTKVIWPEE